MKYSQFLKGAYDSSDDEEVMPPRCMCMPWARKVLDISKHQAHKSQTPDAPCPPEKTPEFSATLESPGHRSQRDIWAEDQAQARQGQGG